jgi:hypothetical protein
VEEDVRVVEGESQRLVGKIEVDADVERARRGREYGRQEH